MFRFTKKRLLTALSAVALLGAVGGVIAYWTSAGSGTAGSTGTITLGGTIAPGLVPGGSESVTLTASNSGTAPIKVQTVHLVSVAVDAGYSGCAVADFTMPDVVENEAIPGGATNHALATAGTLSYANTAVSRNVPTPVETVGKYGCTCSAPGHRLPASAHRSISGKLGGALSHVGATVIGAVFNLNHPAHTVDWHFIHLSVANVVVIGLMLVVFALAILLPFPGAARRRGGGS